MAKGTGNGPGRPKAAGGASALDDELPDSLKADPVAQQAQEGRVKAQEAEQELSTMAPASDAEALAKCLCADAGERPGNFRLGRPRWEAYLPAARQHIAAFDFLMAARGQDEDEADAQR